MVRHQKDIKVEERIKIYHWKKVHRNYQKELIIESMTLIPMLKGRTEVQKES